MTPALEAFAVAGDVLEGRVPQATFRDKIVVVGATAPVLKDVFPTSASSDDLMAGPEIQAAAIQTVLDDFPMRAAPGWVDGLLIVLLGGVGALATAQLGPARGTAIGLAVALLFAGAAQLMFGAGLIVAVLAPLAALVLAVVGAVGVAAAVHGFDRERVRELFSRFVPEPSSTRSSSAPTRTFASAANGASSPSCSATSAASRATARTARPRRSSESSTAT